MRLGITIGTVTLVQPHATMRGGVLRLVVPLAAGIWLAATGRPSRSWPGTTSGPATASSSPSAKGARRPSPSGRSTSP